jgi:hypothetical protein
LLLAGPNSLEEQKASLSSSKGGKVENAIVVRDEKEITFE